MRLTDEAVKRLRLTPPDPGSQSDSDEGVSPVPCVVVIIDVAKTCAVRPCAALVVACLSFVVE